MEIFRAVQEFLGLNTEEEHASAADPGGEAKLPLCFILDAEGGTATAKLLRSHNVRAEVFGSSDEMARALGQARPQLIILGSMPPRGLRDIIGTLGGFPGSVQPVLDNPADRSMTALVASNSGVRILPAVQAPMSMQSINALIKSEGLARTEYDTPEVDLDAALLNNWIEFWYQPRIDLKTRMLAGAECIPRLRHPVHGVLRRSSFMPNASKTGLRILGRNAIRAAAKDWSLFLKIGHNVPIATRLPRAMWDGGHMMPALRRHHPGMSEWPGMGFDLECEDLEAGLNLETYAGDLMEFHGVRIGLRDFRPSSRTLAALRDFPFSKIKLPTDIVRGVAADEDKQRQCLDAIEVAHRSGSRVAASGVEAPEDIKFLMSAGCDIAQGGLFAPPLPREEFVSLLRARARGVSASRDEKGAKAARAGRR